MEVQEPGAFVVLESKQAFKKQKYEVMSRGYRNQYKRASNGQSWNNLNNRSNLVLG